jgi:uncharacterized protein
VARRYDQSRLDGYTKLSTGGLKVDGNLTRTGIFSYKNPDGSERREYRPDSTVFAEDALGTLSEAPVTVGHPAGGVSSENWRRLAVGHTGTATRKDHLVTAPLIIQDASAVAKIEAGELVEISCGYDIDYDPTPGETPEGERYDGIQKNIRGNHVALLPSGKARGGSECSLRLDSNGDEEISKISAMTPEQITALQNELQASKERADAAEGKASALTAQLAVANDPKRLDAAVTERVGLLNQAREDGLTVAADATPNQIRLAVIAKRSPTFRADGLGDEGIKAAYAVTLAMPHPTLATVAGSTVTVTHSDEGDRLETARNEYVKFLHTMAAPRIK